MNNNGNMENAAAGQAGSERKIVVVNNAFTEEINGIIRREAERLGFSVSFFDSEEAAYEEAKTAEIIYGYTPKLAASCSNLKWLCLHSAGADAFLKPGAFANESCLLTNASGAYGATIAEYLVMVTLMLLRRLRPYEETMAKREWLRPPLPQKLIRDCRFTILGAGDIGTRFALSIRPFEPKNVTGISRSGRFHGEDGDMPYDELYPVSRLDELLTQTDVLVMCLPATKESEGILSAEKIALMPRGSYVINIGRGCAVDENALIKALKDGHLAGAALDVMKHEPLPSDDPLWDAPGLILTPHVAGNLTCDYTCRRNAELFCEDLANYAAGLPLKNLVDRNAGY